MQPEESIKEAMKPRAHLAAEYAKNGNEYESSFSSMTFKVLALTMPDHWSYWNGKDCSVI